MTRALVGTSGWSYPTWRPAFYPTGLAPEDFLASYADRLPAVELNATKYRLPSEEQFARWAGRVPETFRFAVKAPDRVERRLETFEQRVRLLGDRLGCVRIVHEAPRDEGWLELLAGSADPAIRYALDLRDASWDGIEPRLAARGWVRVGDESGVAGWAYLRFRDPPWSDDALGAAASTIHAMVDRGIETFAFFRHEDEPRAPLAALRVVELMAH